MSRGGVKLRQKREAAQAKREAAEARHEAARARHAIERAAERYGERLSVEDVRHIRDMIVSKQAVAMTTGLNREQWLVMLRGRAFRVIYDRAGDAICTMVPPGSKMRRDAAARRASP